MLNQFFPHQFVIAASQTDLCLVEIGLCVVQVFQLTETDVVIIPVYQTVAEECHHCLFMLRQVVFAQLMHETYLLVFVEQFLNLLLQFTQ